MLKAMGNTDIGNVRETNQDDFNCGVLGEDAVFAVVCDGMGGEKGGNIASRTACDIVTDSVTAAYGSGFGDNSIRSMLQTAVTAANVSVFDRSQRDPELRGMGTTIVAAIVTGEVAHIVHAGDSRAYHIKNDGTIEQVTKDHSVVQLLVDRGEITADEARFHPKKHFITRALGVMSIIDLDYCEFPMAEGEAILVCTDGLSNYFSNEDLGEMVKAAGYNKCVDKLIAAAKKEGGADNITVVCITR